MFRPPVRAFNEGVFMSDNNYRNEELNTEGISMAEDPEINLDDFFEPDDPDNPLSDSLNDILRSVNEGELSIGVYVTDAFGEPKLSGEYDDCRAEISIMGDVTMCSFRGSKESMDGMWKDLERYKTALSSRVITDMESESDSEEPYPVCTFILVPADYFGQYYIQLSLPSIWAFSAESYGSPATELRIAFPTELSDVFETEASYIDDIGDLANGGTYAGDSGYLDEGYEDEGYLDDEDSTGDPWFQSGDLQ